MAGIYEYNLSNTGRSQILVGNWNEENALLGDTGAGGLGVFFCYWAI